MTRKFFTTILLLFSITITILAQENAVISIMTKKYDPATNLVVWPDEFNPEKAKWYVYNEIEINAKPEVVWNILIDAQKWHSFYHGVQSPVKYKDTTATTLRNGLTFNPN